MAEGQVHVAGSRSFSAEVIDFALDAGLEVLGLVEPGDPARVGTTIHEREVVALESGPPAADAAVLIGTGDPQRREIVARLEAAGWRPIGLVHPSAHVAPSAEVDPRALVAPGVVIGARARVGAHAVIGRGALVGHHTELGEFVTINPGANVAGNVSLGADAFVGMGAVVRDHITVGAAAVIAMGAVVVGDVPAGIEVLGIPAAERL